MKYVLIDSTILVRFLTRDFEDQYNLARDLFAEVEDGITAASISLLSIQELVWLLEFTYQIPREDFVPLLIKLFSLKNIKILDCRKRVLIETFEKFAKNSLDFSSTYILITKERRELVSFDRKLMKLL